MDLLLALVVGLAVYGAIHGIRMYRADAELPVDLAIALNPAPRAPARWVPASTGSASAGPRWCCG
ncbi:Membrane protein OS=Streptomyces microflavus OX=1919 GN=Smic_53150 PE=4 SV=1 [Streptomyces microflavus]